MGLRVTRSGSVRPRAGTAVRRVQDAETGDGSGAWKTGVEPAETDPGHSSRRVSYTRRESIRRE